MKPKIMLITWKDTAVFSTIVADKAEAEEKAQTAVINQVGFLISEDEEKVIIGWQYHEYNKKFRHISSIPKSSILKKIIISQ